MTEGKIMSASENGHTPGPWEFVPAGVAPVVQKAGEFPHGFICNVGSQNFVADARLIAAAPEMHEAGRKLANEVAGLKAFEHELRAVIGNTNWSVLMQRLAEAEAAISKAEGGAA